MKKISFVALTAAFVLLSGCNKDNTIDNSVDIELDNTTDMQLIKLGGGTVATSAKTRASVELLKEMSGTMGVFCLAARKTDVKNADPNRTINWTTVVSNDLEKYGSTLNGTYWDNVLCKVKKDEERNVYQIIPDPDVSQTYYTYYPMNSWFGYDFYGYYPCDETCAVGEKTSTRIYVDMNIDGTKDVIWGKSETPDVAALAPGNAELQSTLLSSYYSARFFRKHPNLQEEAPMKLEHLLARFCFFVEPGPDKEFETPLRYDGAKKLRVKRVTIHQVESHLRLIVADCADAALSGTLSARPDASHKMDFVLQTKAGLPLSVNPVSIETTYDENGVEIPFAKPLGDCIMLLPGGSKHYMSVVFEDENGNEYPSESDIAISLADGKTFEAGNTYNVRLQVSGIKNIGITAELAAWGDGQDMDIVEFN